MLTVQQDKDFMDPLGMCISQCLTVVNESEDDMLYSQGYCLDLVHAHRLSTCHAGQRI